MEIDPLPFKLCIRPGQIFSRSDVSNPGGFEEDIKSGVEMDGFSVSDDGDFCDEKALIHCRSSLSDWDWVS